MGGERGGEGYRVEGEREEKGRRESRTQKEGEGGKGLAFSSS